MQITKFLHSCLFIEEQDKTILLDPGNYSAAVLDINSIHKLDAIGITHEHMDHMDVGFLKKLLQKFPHTPIFSTENVKKILGKESIEVFTEGNEFLQLESVPHEKIWMGSACQNVMIIFFHKLSHPGDSLSFPPATEVLALPITAPWGSTTWAVDVAEKFKPKIIIPIHDFHWKDEVRIGMYERLEQYFAAKNISFLKPETGKPLTITI